MTKNRQNTPASRLENPNGPSGSPTVQNDLQHIISSPTFRMKHLELKLIDRYKNRKQETLVSVIMPTWNRRRVIKRAIDSVMAQSYQNYELIISDDGSTDGTGNLLLHEYGQVPKLLYLCNEHRGVSYARNSALEKARGQLIAYLDTDNQWDTNFLMLMVNSLEDSPEKSTAYCGIRVINEIRQARFTRLVDYDRMALEKRNFIDMNIFIHRKSLFRRYGGFAHDVEPLEDWELILRYTKENPPLVVNCCLANYYIAKEINHQSLICETDLSYKKIRALYCD